jgi:hypothetical protein
VISCQIALKSRTPHQACTPLFLARFFVQSLYGDEVKMGRVYLRPHSEKNISRFLGHKDHLAVRLCRSRELFIFKVISNQNLEYIPYHPDPAGSSWEKERDPVRYPVICRTVRIRLDTDPVPDGIFFTFKHKCVIIT